MTMRTIVFDLGGVLVQWRPLELLRQVLPQRARDEASAREVVAQIFQSHDPQADWLLFDLGHIEPAALATRIAARSGYGEHEVRAVIDAIPQHIQPLPASVALVQRLHRAGVRLHYLSNMPAPFADHLEARHMLFEHFDGGVFSGRVGLLKPQAAMFDHARETLRLDLAHTLFIDDHAGNVEAACALGWQALQFEHAAQCEAALVAQGWLRAT